MSEESVKWLRCVCTHERWNHPLAIEEARDILSAIDARDAEIERLRSDAKDADAEIRRLATMVSLRRSEVSAQNRPTPTLAEVAMLIMAATYSNPGWYAPADVAALNAVDAAEALLAELERRGTK